MNIIARLTRFLSKKEIDKKTSIRTKDILERLLTGEKTAKELAIELYELEKAPSNERNCTAPRLSELERQGYVEITGKKKSNYSGRLVSVYAITSKGIDKLFIGKNNEV